MSKLLSTEKFILRAKSVHFDKYDYSLAEYKTYRDKITIICPIHGKFEQQVQQHLEGRGCRHCGYEILRELKKFSKEDFVQKAISIHGDKYDYSKFNYVNTKTKGEIICSKHGSFWQKPENHTWGKGCRKCSYEKLRNENGIGWAEKYTGREGIFYILKCWNNEETFYKVGVTSTSVKDRYSTKKSMPYQYKVLRIITSPDLEYIFELESRNKKKLSKFLYKPLQYFPGSMSECFTSIVGVSYMKDQEQMIKELPEELREAQIKQFEYLDNLVKKITNQNQ